MKRPPWFTQARSASLPGLPRFSVATWAFPFVATRTSMSSSAPAAIWAGVTFWNGTCHCALKSHLSQPADSRAAVLAEVWRTPIRGRLPGSVGGAGSDRGATSSAEGVTAAPE